MENRYVFDNIEDFDVLKAVNHTQHRPLVSGQAASMIDENGKAFLDFNEICVVLGQNNRHFIDRMTEALKGVTSNKVGFSDNKRKLLSYLSETTGHRFQAVHLTASGSETTEWAVKLAMKLTGKTEVLSFWNSIHGRTHLSASMSGMPRRKNEYGPVCPGVVFAPYPDVEHLPFTDTDKYFEYLDQKIKYESANDIAAVIVEPYQGSGVILPPKGWLKALENWAHARGALFILDEIQSGMGRSGSLYRFTEEGLEPDMVLLGKALGNGVHVSALLMRQVPEEKYLLALTGGAGDDALACAAGCAVYEELLENGLLEHIQAMSARMESHLQALKDKYPAIRQVRCMGLACAVEIGDTDTFKKLSAAVKAEGLLVSPSIHNSLMLKPPYTVTAEQIDKMAAILDGCLEALA